MVRFAAVATLLLAFTAPALAQDLDSVKSTGELAPSRPGASLEPADRSQMRLPLDASSGVLHVIDAQSSAVQSVDRSDRPQMLLPLYASFGVLQVFDAHSTARALRSGATESNPLMTGVVGHSATVFAVKAGGAAAVIYATERLWKRNPAAAVGFMIAANAGMGWVVQHNYRVAR